MLMDQMMYLNALDAIAQVAEFSQRYPGVIYAVIFHTDKERRLAFRKITGDFTATDQGRKICFDNGSRIHLLIRSELIVLRGLELSHVLVGPDLTDDEIALIKSRIRRVHGKAADETQGGDQ